MPPYRTKKRPIDMIMLTKLTQPVLVLNKNWLAIGTTPVYKVVNILLSKSKAQVIDESCVPHTWEEWSRVKPDNENDGIFTVNNSFKIPQVIRLVKYDKYPRQVVIFSRNNIFKRDEFKCQYCGEKPGSEELTIDHIIPKCKNGKTTWENCVLSCIDCNSIKGGSLMHEIKHRKFPKGMALIKNPIRPKLRDLKFHVYYESWKQWLDSMYWNIELENNNAKL